MSKLLRLAKAIAIGFPVCLVALFVLAALSGPVVPAPAPTVQAPCDRAADLFHMAVDEGRTLAEQALRQEHMQDVCGEAR